VGKYTSVNSEVDFNTDGTLSLSDLNLIGTFPINADSFVTARTGLMSAFQGYGAADRAVGALSPTFLPTPKEGSAFTYNGYKKAGEGLEVAYNWKDTHVSAQVTNGYNSKKASTQLGEDNHYKDFGLFVNQMIGESAIGASFYKGTSGYSKTGAEAAASPFSAEWYDNYVRGILYGTAKFLPNDKLDLLLGVANGYDHIYKAAVGNSEETFHSVGMFATLQTVQKVMQQQLTSAVSYGTNRPSLATAGNRTSDVTVSFAVPIENSKFDVSFQGKRTQAVGSQDVTAHIAQAQWLFMF
jgi:hypothetical protein